MTYSVRFSPVSASASDFCGRSPETILRETQDPASIILKKVSWPPSAKIAKQSNVLKRIPIGERRVDAGFLKSLAILTEGQNRIFRMIKSPIGVGQIWSMFHVKRQLQRDTVFRCKPILGYHCALDDRV
ncbi:MAG: hypothetical protein HYU73_17575 [Betaproteobacteria bacterium]|nr:hypothetical protein [Betaproteobacteria bacterium]